MVLFPKLSAMSGMLQQAKQVQEKIEELQSELAALRIEGRAGGGLVTASYIRSVHFIEISLSIGYLIDDNT